MWDDWHAPVLPISESGDSQALWPDHQLYNVYIIICWTLCSTCWRLWSSGGGQPGSVTTDPPLVPSLSMHLECREDSGSVFQKWYFKRYKSCVTTALPNLDAFQCTSMWQQKTWRRVDDIPIRSKKKRLNCLTDNQEHCPLKIVGRTQRSVSSRWSGDPLSTTCCAAVQQKKHSKWFSRCLFVCVAATLLSFRL